MIQAFPFPFGLKYHSYPIKSELSAASQTNPVTSCTLFCYIDLLRHCHTVYCKGFKFGILLFGEANGPSTSFSNSLNSQKRPKYPLLENR